MSYRREETAYAAGWLFDRLVEHLGAGQVFKDVDSIELGDDFVDAIDTAVGSCDVLLALIGSQWLTTADEQGNRRLDDPADFVRLEIEAALKRGVRVIPILVAGATMPRANEIPPGLARLVRRQALELSPSRFEFDTSRLLTVLDKTLAEVRTGRAVGHPPSAPPVEAAPVIGTGTRRAPAPEVEPATPARPPPDGREDTAGGSAARHRARPIWASRAGRLAIAAALVALVAVSIIVALGDGDSAGSPAQIAALESALPQGAEPCRPASDPYLVQEQEPAALAQVDCGGTGEGSTLTYGRYSDAKTAASARDNAVAEKRSQGGTNCPKPISELVDNGATCQLTENDTTLEITWTQDRVMGVVNFNRDLTEDREAVEAWKRLV